MIVSKVVHFLRPSVFVAFVGFLLSNIHDVSVCCENQSVVYMQQSTANLVWGLGMAQTTHD